MNIDTIVGSQTLSTGSTINKLRQDRSGALAVSQAHGRFQEIVQTGNVYSGGGSLIALSANTISLTATTTPIIGVWNTPTSGVNLVILQASLQLMSNNLTSGAGPGAFVWAYSVGNNSISTGSAPFDRKTMNASGSQAKYFAGNVALTGLTNSLVIFEGADFPSPSGMTYTTIASTALMPGYQATQNFDGSIFVPPGGVLALLNTTSCTTFSATSRILWEECPV